VELESSQRGVDFDQVVWAEMEQQIAGSRYVRRTISCTRIVAVLQSTSAFGSSRGHGRSFWRNRKYHLDQMMLGELVGVYVQHPTVLTYAALLAASATLAIWLSDGPPRARAVQIGAPATVAVLVYPLAEYLLHRFVLHSRFLYRSPLTVSLWSRIHYDHHADPDDLRVLFGALYTTLPPIAAVTLPIGLAISGATGVTAAFGAGVVCMLVYEFCHCLDHLHCGPRNPILQAMRRRHLLHHFHNERGNFGITNFVCDRLVGTLYDTSVAVPRSETVFNLGYGEAERQRYLWLARIAGTPIAADRDQAKR
jgi:sterol desaturase/sphingolipid hydroxylase (fatty acid hydroxylase superfamily)